MICENLQWHVVYTRPCWEKKVAASLTKTGIVNYCPLNKVHRQWSDRKKIILEPLFKSYVFLHINQKHYLDVKKTDGILNFLFWQGKPAIVKDLEIEIIRRFMNEYHNVQLEQQLVSLHDKVRITNGPLMLREGNVLEVRNKTVKVLIPSLNLTLVAEVEKSNVEKIPAFSNDIIGYSQPQHSRQMG